MRNVSTIPVKPVNDYVDTQVLCQTAWVYIRAVRTFVHESILGKIKGEAAEGQVGPQSSAAMSWIRHMWCEVNRSQCNAK